MQNERGAKEATIYFPVAELIEMYGLPPQLAEFYEREAEFFREIRKLRDSVVHHGKDVPPILQTDQGLAVRAFDSPWVSFAIWEISLLKDDRLGSLRAVFAF